MVLAPAVEKSLWEKIKSFFRRLGRNIKRGAAFVLRKVRTLLRFIELMILFSPVAVLAVLAAVGMLFGIKPTERYHLLAFRLFRWAMERAGCAFVKLGQWMSHREDMFPGPLCALLRELRADAPAHSFTHTKETIQRAFGKPLDDIFVWFAPKPIASGSIAQVHEAWVKDARKPRVARRVAVKGERAP